MTDEHMPAPAQGANQSVNAERTSVTPPVESTSLPETATNKKMFGMGVGIIAAVLVLAAVAFTLFGVYKQASASSFVVQAARVLNLPALKVNEISVPYATYQDDMKAIQHVQAYTAQNNGGTSKLTNDQLSDQVIQRLVQDALVQQMARKYGVSVSASELDAYEKSILSQRGVTSTAAADEILTSMYGWNLDTYKHKVMAPVVLYQKVAEKVQNDPEAQKDIKQFAKDRAQYIIDNIKSDTDFTRFAMQYGEDGTAQNGGDLGWFSKGDMQADFEKVAWALKKGEMTKEPVESPFGFHIIKVDDHKYNLVKDEKTGKMVSKDQVKARHILITPSLDKFLEMTIKETKVKVYIPVHNPFADIAQK